MCFGEGKQLQRDLDQGIAAAIEMIQQNPDEARELFGALDVVGFINNYNANGLITIGDSYTSTENNKRETKAFRDGGVGAVTNYAAGSYPSPNGAVRISANPITVNAHGFFVSGQDPSGTRVQNLKGAGFEGVKDIKTIRGLVIIHEIAHATGVIPLDGDNPAASRANSERVRKLFAPKH